MWCGTELRKCSAGTFHKETSASGMYMQKQMGSDSDDQLFICFLNSKDFKILTGS